MSCVTKLKAALAAAPVGRPCTAAAVRALYVAGHGASRQLSPHDRYQIPANDLLEACTQQQLPGACLPVLAWLAAGLRSGLPPAATQQAHELACALLGVMTQVLHDGVVQLLMNDPLPDKPLVTSVQRAVEPLGSQGVLCRQLAQVTAALMATTFPGAPSRTSSTNSNTVRQGIPTTMQLVALARAWERIGMLLTALAVVAKQEDFTLGTDLTSSGLFQTMVEGALLLLATNPATYPQATPEQERQLWLTLWSASSAAMFLGGWLGNKVNNAWATAPNTCLWMQGKPASGSITQPWMWPLCKLQVLMLAKMQWDARECPDHIASIKFQPPWPAEALKRAVPQLRSPSVAGQLLRQRAPGLVPHTRTMKHPERIPGGGSWVEVVDFIRSVAPAVLGVYLNKLRAYLEAAAADDLTLDVLDAQDLSLLLEASELYCLVCPSARYFDIEGWVWPVACAMSVCPAEVLTTFAATSGEAVISIAEQLVQDVRVSSSAAAATPSSSSTTTTSSSSSNTCKQLMYGGGNPAVKLEHRRNWCLDVLLVCKQVQEKQQLAASRPNEHEGGKTAAALIATATTTDWRIGRLLETTLRLPCFVDTDPGRLLLLLPWTVPGLHAAASNPAGSAALLAAMTSAAKRQQVLNVALAALVAAGGQTTPAAARVLAAVPGPMGQALADRVTHQPAAVVRDATSSGISMMRFADKLMLSAVALLDPQLAPVAIYAVRNFPVAHCSKPWGVQFLLNKSDSQEDRLGYRSVLSTSSQQAADLLEGLAAAVAAQHGSLGCGHAAEVAQAAGAGQLPTADMQVAATALLTACKAAGAVAQLLEEMQGAMKQQPWGREQLHQLEELGVGLPLLHSSCSKVADWALLLAPVLGQLLPPGQAAQLQEVAAGVSRDSEGSLLLTPDAISRVLGLLGHVAAPGVRGCSYPGCCNLEGRTEAELPVQVCSKCKGVRYCCREHQVAHWKAGHKEVCQAAQAAVKQVCDVAAGGCDDQVHSEIMG